MVFTMTRVWMAALKEKAYQGFPALLNGQTLCPLIFFHFLKLSVDHVIVFRYVITDIIACSRFISLLSGVHLLGHTACGFGQCRGCRFHGTGVIAFNRFFCYRDRSFDCCSLLISRMLTRFFKRLARRVHHTISCVAGDDKLLELLIRLCIDLGIVHHLLNISI